MSELVYYLRKDSINGQRGVPFGTVVVSMNEDGTVNRGVAICAKNDHFDKKMGRRIAAARHRMAVEAQSNISFREYHGQPGKISNCHYGRCDVANFSVEPTDAEKRMFSPPPHDK